MPTSPRTFRRPIASSNSPNNEPSEASSLPRHYPNPGYLGVSSHSTIFNQVFSSTIPHGAVPELSAGQPVPPLQHDSIWRWNLIEKASFLVERVDLLDIPQLACLVRSWIDRGVCLPLAEPFVSRCTEAVVEWTEHTNSIPSAPEYSSVTRQRVSLLLEKTKRAIDVRQTSGFEDLLGQIVGPNLRLEAVGIFLTAAARATLDTVFFPSLFACDAQRRALILTLSFLGDACLEICLALDCLNDLQLVVQYENLILHSQVDGDQSQSLPLQCYFMCLAPPLDIH